MTPKVAISGARWEAIEVLLDRSLELEPASQDALIEATRSTDPVLAGELARLVDAGRHLGGFLEQPAALYAAPLLAWAAERAPLQPGTTLGPYEIVRRLGRGATATVYLSRDPKHDREVAVKVLHPEIAESVGPERFLHEIQLAATLHHPHILPLFDSGRMAGSEGAGDLLYYVMPHVEGESLRGHLSEGRLPRDEAVRIAREVAGALDYSHRRGVIHRDIKPENILLQDGQAIVADFGIARALDASGADRSDTGGTGTPAYMSPEQRRPGAPVDGRTDVYSLGCVLYEMLTGEPPFAGSSIDEIVRRQAAGPPASLLARGLNVPSSLDRAVTRALAGTAGRALRDRGAFAEALESAGHETPGRPRSRAWIGMAGAGAIAAGVAGTWLWPHGPQVVPRRGAHCGAAVRAADGRHRTRAPRRGLGGDREPDARGRGTDRDRGPLGPADPRGPDSAAPHGRNRAGPGPPVRRGQRPSGDAPAPGRSGAGGGHLAPKRPARAGGARHRSGSRREPFGTPPTRWCGHCSVRSGWLRRSHARA